MGETGKSRVQPAFDGSDFILADDNFCIGEGGDMNAHRAEEICGKFCYCCSVDDELYNPQNEMFQNPKTKRI